jgi:hypothetical protein
MGSNLNLLVWGGLLVGLGIFILWRTSRHDLKGWVWDSVWHVARRKRTAANPTVLERKFEELRAEKSMMGRARRTAGYVVRHFVAQALAILALVLVLSGIALLLYGFFRG